MERIMEMFGFVAVLAIVVLLVFITIGIWKPLIGDPRFQRKALTAINTQAALGEQYARDIEMLKKQIIEPAPK